MKNPIGYIDLKALKAKNANPANTKRKRGRPVTHGRSKDPIFFAWMMMRQRCENPNAVHYENYGGRGIKVCDRWQDFNNFLEDMGERPKDMSLDRIDNDGDYCKENCRWTTCAKQAKNTRNNINITIDGVTRCASDWAQHLGIKRVVIYSRINRGWDPVKAVTTPVNYSYLLK